MPLLECLQCGHDVICHFTILEKYERFWLDLDQDVVLGSGLCESLRHLGERWSEAVGSSIGFIIAWLLKIKIYAAEHLGHPFAHYMNNGANKRPK